MNRMLFLFACLTGCMPNTRLDGVGEDPPDPVDDSGGTADNAPPTAPEIAVTPAAPGPDDTLTCAVVTHSVDPDGDAVRYAYVWQRDGITETEGQRTLSASFTETGEEWTCLVTPSDSALDGPPGRASVTIGRNNTAPTAPVVRIEPTSPSDDDALSCTIVTASVDRDGDDVSYSYAWTMDGVDASVNSNTVPASRTTLGERWACRVTVSDGVATATGESSSALISDEDSGMWTSVWSHALTSTPAGASALNGSIGGQGVATVGGRSCWKQTSDWNVLYVPVTRSTTGVEAVQVDVHTATNAMWFLQPLSDAYGYNGSIDYFGWGNAYSTRLIGLTYGGWYTDNINNGIVLISDSITSATYNTWQTVRAEYDRSSNDLRLYVEGVEIYRTTGVPIASMRDDYVELRGAASGSAPVCWSNLEVFEGGP